MNKSVLLRSGLMAYDEELENTFSCYGSIKENN